MSTQVGNYLRNSSKNKGNSSHQTARPRPERYFLNGRIPENVSAANARLEVIQAEIKRTNALLENIFDQSSEEYQRKAKFIEHSEKELRKINEWLALNSKVEKVIPRLDCSAHEKILETMNFLLEFEKKGLLEPKEQVILDFLIDYNTQKS